MAKNEPKEEYPLPSNQEYLSYYVYQKEWVPTRPIAPIAAMSSSPGPAIVNLPTTIGEERHDPSRSKAPSYRIGHRLKFHDKIEIGPGPGKYDIRDLTNKGKDTCKAPKFGTAKRFRDTLVSYESSPGPAAYDRQGADKLIYPSAPSFSVPSSQRGKVTAVTTPGPNAYQLPPILGPGQTPYVKGPAYSFGKDKRMKETKYAQNPGPSAYMLPSSNVNMSKAPAYSMGSKAVPPKVGIYGPGPAAYSAHLVKFDKYSTPRFTFGIRHSPHKALPGFDTDK